MLLRQQPYAQIHFWNCDDVCAQYRIPSSGYQKLIVNAEASYVVAPDGSGGVSAPVFNLEIKLPGTRMQWSVQLHNLLDVDGFNRHQFSPFQWQTNTEALFGRYVKVAGNFKFR